MKNKAFSRYYLLSVIGVLLASWYPLRMGVLVAKEIITRGHVRDLVYPQYLIPYTPLATAVLLTVLLMPLCFRLAKKRPLIPALLFSTAFFFLFELLLEYYVIVVSADRRIMLADWQMFSCIAITPEREYTALDILSGGYHPGFKLHFYMISMVLIFSILNCIFGFAQLIRSGEKKRLRILIVQSVCTLIFLGLCVLACLTAFWRTGMLRVSPLSASLMAIFFTLLGVTVGVFVGSHLLGKKTAMSILIPSVCASLTTLLMYVGEMILLSGRLYRFGTGFFFDALPGIVLSPVDILIVLLSGVLTAGLCAFIRPRTPKPTKQTA